MSTQTQTQTQIQLEEVREITLTRAEGKKEQCNIPTIVYTFQEAQQTLIKWSHNAPKEHHGYHKVDFFIAFWNGDTYKGRYDLQKDGYESDKVSLEQHVQNHCQKMLQIQLDRLAYL